jgi:hypothetical protein
MSSLVFSYFLSDTLYLRSFSHYQVVGGMTTDGADLIGNLITVQRVQNIICIRTIKENRTNSHA